MYENAKAGNVTGRCAGRFRQHALAAILAASVVGGVVASGPAMGQSGTAPAQPLEEEIWKLLTFGEKATVIVFAVNADGEIQAYKSASMPDDPNDYPQTELKHRSIGLTIGGATRVCWTTPGGDEQCEPPR